MPVAEKQSTADLMDEVSAASVQMSALLGAVLPAIGELDRRGAFRGEGATSMAAWVSHRCNVSESTARVWAYVAQHLWDLPLLLAALCDGSVTFDKVRLVVGVANPETDALWADRARVQSIDRLGELVRAHKGKTDEDSKRDYEGRHVRFNATRNTMTAQFTPDTFARVRAVVEDEARTFPSDGEVRWDQRKHDALVDIVTGSSSTTSNSTPTTSRSSSGSSPFTVVVHTTLDYLRGEEGSADIERGGLLSHQTIQRLSCDANVVLAVDSDIGHTMFEGRMKRYPTTTQKREAWRRDRHCRFPGCTNESFMHVHHVQHWAAGGRTDVTNLALLCAHHHHRVHEGAWAVTGDANDVLTFVGPMGRPLHSRPSPLWTRTN